MKKLNKKLIQIKNHCDSKDFVHCILYFIKEGDRLSEGMKGFINYVFSLDIQSFFIVTHCVLVKQKDNLYIIITQIK